MRFLKFAALFAVLSLVWVTTALVLAFYGWWMTPVAPAGDHGAFYQWASDELQAKNKGSSAFVLVKNGRVFGEFYHPEPSVDGDTLFPSASFSKLITALGVLSLRDKGVIDLDAPVASYLTKWQLPESSFDNNKVTVRRLLSHTAGLTDGLGFGDYTSDEKLPTTVESLAAPRSSKGNKVIKVGVEPGSEFNYSGGGYLILQLLIEEVTGDTFADYIARTILAPTGMQRSTYSYFAQQPNATSSFNTDGSIAPSYKYASPAATGFNTTARDLTKLAQELLADDNGTFSRRLRTSMREPHGYLLGVGVWGLGTILYAPSQSGDVLFGHDGGNDPALNTTLRINPDNADAIVVLVSGHPSLATAIGADWVLWQTGYPDVLSTARVFASAVLPIGVGVVALLIVVLVIARRTPAKGNTKS